MRKIPTIFVRDWEGTVGPPGRFVLDEPHPDCGWVFAGEGVATRKLDGTCCLVRDGVLYKRLEVKGGKVVPDDFDQVEIDDQTGNRVGWVPVGDGPEDKWHREAWDRLTGGVEAEAGAVVPEDGTYELVGRKVQGNPEGFADHTLVSHANAPTCPAAPRDFGGLRDWLATQDIEGIVWHHPDGRMGKIKGKDFGLKRG